MKQGNQKNKGNNFEREVADLLSEIYDESFIRVPNSGAFIGGKNQYRASSLDSAQQKTFRGDIITPDGWDLVIECKHYKEPPSWNRLFNSFEKTDIARWIEELRYDSKLDDGKMRPHIIICKFNRQGIYFIVDKRFAMGAAKSAVIILPNDYYIYPWRMFLELGVDKRIKEAAIES